MFKLVEGKDTFEKALPSVNFDKCFQLIKDDRPLGVGTINKDKENLIYIYIKQELRGNGYGKVLFSKMMEEAKKEGYQEVKVTFPKDNIQMVKIVDDNGGMQKSTDNNQVKYVIPLK